MAISFTPRRLPGLLASAFGAVLLLGAGSAHALGLVQAYELALQNDPAYREAIYENEGGREYKVLGRSALLPTLQGSYSASKVHADQETITALGRNPIHPQYVSRSGVVQLRQPLFSLDSVARYRQGAAQSKYSEFRFESMAQDLVLRVVGGYVDVLLAEEQLALAKAQRDALAEQQKVNQRLFEKGEGTRTDMLETQARLELSEAQVIEAQDNLATARNTLSGIVGTEVKALDPLSPDFRVRPLQPGGFEEWKKLAQENNPELQSQQAAIEIAHQEINKARAGHAPRLDFIGSYSRSSAESLNTYLQDATSRSVGIQLNIPLYSGGAVNASTRQAAANYEKSRAELQTRSDKVLVDLRKQYNLVQSSVARMEALVKAVESGKLLMQATEQSIKGGVRINLDLLNAQQQLYVSQRDLAQARYTYLAAGLRLRAQAGVLGADDVRQVASYFR